MKKLKTKKFCFCTIASAGYIKYALGLFENLQEFYPGSELLICCLDNKTAVFFDAIDNPLLKTVSPEKVWGDDFWKNICCRMQINERAFATKPAMMQWILQNGYDYTMFLDSDILFLDKIDDIMEKVITSKVVLIPSYIAPDNWQKTKHGIVCAGFISFSNDAIDFLETWKVLCFEKCVNSPIEHLFYEQKYLDPLISQPGIVIINDDGVNVSATDFKRFNIVKKDKSWYVNDYTKLRVFHASSTTDPSIEFMKIKSEYDNKAYKKYHPEPDSIMESSSSVSRKTSKNTLAKIAHLFQYSAILMFTYNTQVKFLNFINHINRTISLKDYNLTTRLQETFSRKKKLLTELKNRK